ncbi:sigma-54-dependent transcriptional regulator [Thalassotalea profundi]|uniref:Sigma-54-dependent Fis family transcriptional regulator n=1 Tax=Thalassotalea profundi TaxID=2036687 RepID=A0ABQ3J7H2_9GAMM|nr:sigma-54 dependent transcriptional regulator [Thalassotalea profundi]GHF02804.1 sigma-54-dependent Fis family transcriptional regulator [Thalassotalea profundi]
MPSILVVDDRPDIRLSLVVLLESHGHMVVEADTPQVAQSMLGKHEVALILLDMNYALDTTSGEEGLSFLSWLQKQNLTIPVIAMTAWSNTEIVVKAMQLGANDFIEKPWRNKQLLHVIGQQLNIQRLTLQNTQLKSRIDTQLEQPYQWRSEVMQKLHKKIEAIANTDVSVLLMGENGTGKTELARYIHQQSLRADQGFISVNMGAISEGLFESEMFGHQKGAFTDAKSSRVGRFELAEKGSLFLDEIANIPLSQQAKLLRVLETGEYEVLGASKTRRSNTRIISATNSDLNGLISQKLFREDLYYRLNTLEFVLPTLRERTEDILPLALYFVAKFNKKYQKNIDTLSKHTEQALLNYQWPGNVREMRHLIERAVILASTNQLTLADLPIAPINDNESDCNQKHTLSASRELPMMTLEQAEITLVKQALEKAKHNVPKAAILLGLTKASMYRRIEKYGINKK